MSVCLFTVELRREANIYRRHTRGPLLAWSGFRLAPLSRAERAMRSIASFGPRRTRPKVLRKYTPGFYGPWHIKTPIFALLLNTAKYRKIRKIRHYYKAIWTSGVPWSLIYSDLLFAFNGLVNLLILSQTRCATRLRYAPS